MAEAIGLAASILQVAVFGASVVTTLRTLSSSYSSAEQKVKDLSTDISLTASILTSLGNTIQEYEYDLHFKEHQFLPAKEACERNFQRLRKALKEAKKGEDGKGKAKSLTAWDKLMYALGGEDEIKGLVVSIETSKSTLQLLLDSVNLLVLKRLSKKHLLDEDQAEDLKLLVRHLPSLFKSLQSAGLVGPGPAKPVFTPKESTTVFMHIANENPLPPNVSARDLPVEEVNITTIPAEGTQGAEKEVVPEWLEDVPEVPNDAKQDFQVTEDEGPKADEQFRVFDVNGKENEKPDMPGMKDEDNDTRSSHSSIEDPYLYEGWLLENRKHIPGPTVISFCGLKIKVHQDPNGWDDDYFLSPRTLDRDFLKLLVTKSDTKSTDPRVTFLESLDTEAQDAVKELIQDRNDNTSKPYSWVLAAIVDVARENGGTVKKALFWTRKKEKGDQSPRWMIVLKGGLHDSIPKQPNVPDKYYDPWAPENNKAALEMAAGRAPEIPSVARQAAKTVSEVKATNPLADTKKQAIRTKKQAIRFKDAVGRRFCFPFELACTWPGMEELIRQAFLHVEVLGPHVHEGHYDLVGPTGEIILPQVWETVVEPAWAVTMNMWPMPATRPPPPPPPPGLKPFGRPRSPPGPILVPPPSPPPPPRKRRGPPPLGGELRPQPHHGRSTPVVIDMGTHSGSKSAPAERQTAGRTSSTESASTRRTRSSSPDEYTARLEEDLRKSGLDEKNIAEVTKKAGSKKDEKNDSCPGSSPVRDSSISRSERNVVEEVIRRREGSPSSSDEVIVIEEHSPPRDYKKSHRTSGYRTVDPSSYGDAVDGNRGRRFKPKAIRRSRSQRLRSLHWEEELDPEQAEANKAIDEFLGTLVDDDYVSGGGSSSTSESLVDD